MFEQFFNISPLKFTFVIYTVGMLAIGLSAYLRTKNLSDYILGGRKMGIVVTALSAGASDMSGWLLMGLPGAVYMAGLSQSWIAIGLALGAFTNWYLLAGRLRIHTEVCNDSLTIPDYLRNRFQDKTKMISVISAIIILIFFTVYCASGIVAGGKLFVATFEIPYTQAIWYGAIVTIIYVFIGGYIAVSWTDTVQAALMFFALAALPIFCFFAINKVTPTDLNSIQILHTIAEDRWDMFDGMTVVGIISLLAWGLGYFGQPHILTRFMAADNVKTIKIARRVSILWMGLCLIGSVAAGFFGYAYFSQIPNSEITQGIISSQGELVFLETTKLLFNPWIAGIVLSAVLAAVMSTLSCQLLVCSSTLTEDLYKGLLRPRAGQKELVWFSRSMVLVVAFVAILLAQNPESNILSLVSNAWAGFGAAFGPVILLSVFWKRMNKLGAIAGMATGALVVIIWLMPLFYSAQGELVSIHDITGIYEIIPGFALSLLAIFIFSMKGKKANAVILENFDKANQIYMKN